MSDELPQPAKDKPASKSPFSPRQISMMMAFVVAVMFGSIIVVNRCSGPRGDSGDGDGMTSKTGDTSQDSGQQGAGASAPITKDAPRDVILISIDTLRADRLSCMGYDKIKTPSIDAVAKEGLLYTRCYTPCPLTLPAHTSILSGTTPIYHRVRGNTYQRVPNKGLAMIQETYKAAGYATGGFISSSVMDKASGIARGFDHYDDDLGDAASKDLTLPERSAEKTLAATQEWLADQDRDQRVFCFVHLFDPHFPFWPPDAAERKLKPSNNFTPEELKPLYDEEVRYTDEQLGRFFAWLKSQKRWENSVVVITADHGEGLGDKGELTHGYFIFDETTHVPLIIKPAKGTYATGKSIDTLVQLHDLVPTLARLSNVKLSEALRQQQQGQDILPYVSSPDPDRRAYVESHYGYINAGWSKMRALRGSDYLAVASSENELYEDSAPRTNVLATEPSDAQRTVYRSAYEELQRVLTTYWSADVAARPRSGGGYAGESAYGYQESYQEGYNESYQEGYQEGYNENRMRDGSYNEGAYSESRAKPYVGESPGADPSRRESIADTKDLPAPHTQADVLAAYQRAELFYSERRYALALNGLEQILETHEEALQPLKLAAKIADRQARTTFARDRSRSRRMIQNAHEYSGRAAKVAKTVGLELAALDLESSELFYALMLADDDTQREAIRLRAAEIVHDGGEMLPQGLRLKLIRLRYWAAYRKHSDTDKRAEIAVLLEKALGKAAVRFDELLQRMKRGEDVRLAPWE